jgi:hypothetical protein
MKRPILIGIIVLQLLLMGAAFVGGRMMADQDRRGGRQSFSPQLPSQLPKEPMAGSGSVQKVQGNIISLSQGRGGLGGGPGGGPGGNGQGSSNSNSGIEVAVSSDTKLYKSGSSGGQGAPGTGQSQSQVQVQEALLTDIKVGNQIMVWGTKSGSRIAAEVLYIQGQSAFGPP